jgi:hypothetical protein
MGSKAHTTPTAPLVLLHSRIHKCAMKKFCIKGQLRKIFFYCDLSFFTCKKATMNDVRICTLRNGVIKTPQFLHFSIAKGETKNIAHLSIAEGSSF